MRTITKFSTNHRLLLSVLFCLFLYVAYRAYNMAITLDEGHSFKILQGNEIIEQTANNHFLNTFMMFVCSRIFGNSELSLRLANVFGFVMYGYACFQLLKNKSFILTLVGISVLLLNPYLLDFFSVARGYGLALGFFMLSLLSLFKATASDYSAAFFKHASYTLLFSILACFSNLTYINSNLIALFVLLIFGIKFHWPFKANRTLVGFGTILLINFLSLGWLLNKLFFLKNTHELYHGGSIGFVHDTLHELTQNSLFRYLHNYSDGFIQSLCWIIIVLFFIICGYTLIIRQYNKLAVIVLFLSLSIMAPIAQFYLLDTLFPFGRTSLIYIPLIGLSAFYFLESIFDKSDKNFIRYFVQGFSLLLFFAPSVYNFSINANLNYCYDWSFNQYTKDAMQLVQSLYPEAMQKGEKVSIVYSDFLESGVRYYKTLNELDYLDLGGENKVYTDEQVLFLLKKEKESSKNLDAYKLIKNYNNGECFLYQKKEKQTDKKETCRKEIHLIAPNKKFVCREWDNLLIANKERPSLWETFSFIKYENNECAFKSFEGLYVCAELKSQSELTATRPQRGGWELFHYVDLGGGFCAIRAANNNYLSIDATTNRIVATSSTIGKSETFKLVELF